MKTSTCGCRSAHLAYLVHKSGRKTSIIISIIIDDNEIVRLDNSDYHFNNNKYLLHFILIIYIYIYIYQETGNHRILKMYLWLIFLWLYLIGHANDVFTSIINSLKIYRNIRRIPMSRLNTNIFARMNNNLSCGRFKQFWNLVWRCKTDNGIIQTDISINSVSAYF